MELMVFAVGLALVGAGTYVPQSPGVEVHEGASVARCEPLAPTASFAVEGPGRASVTPMLTALAYSIGVTEARLLITDRVANAVVQVGPSLDEPYLRISPVRM